MDFATLIAALTPIRVDILLLLIERGATTMGVLADTFDMAPSSMTEHVNCLTNAGLVRTWREGRLVWVVSRCRGIGLEIDWCD